MTHTWYRDGKPAAISRVAKKKGLSVYRRDVLKLFIVATPLALLLGACTATIPPTLPATPQGASAVGTSSASPAAVIAEPNTVAGIYSPPRRTKERACAARGPLPDPTCSPGAVMTTDMTVVCQRSTRERRRVSSEVHREAFTEYGLTSPQPRGAFEVSTASRN